MGCDGGTIPKRDELVRTKKKPEQKDKDSELSFRWQHCTLTQQPLQKPVVACGLGRLYNKDAVIEAILDKINASETVQHIKSLKDVKDLQLTDNPAYVASAEKGDAYIDRQMAPYICPVIGLEMNGKFRFVFLWSCGCVMSERALKIVKTKLCHKCQQPFSEEDVVILNGIPEDISLMQTRMEARQTKLRAEKKLKTDMKRKEKLLETATSSKCPSMPEEIPAGSKQNSNIPVLSVKPLSKLVGSQPESGAVKRPAGSQLSDPLFKKTKGSYSVAQDPRATEVFKSLFTSHRTAQEQTKAHWITYNPFYN